MQNAQAVLEHFKLALRTFLQKDIELLKSGVQERCIVPRIAMYIRESVENREDDTLRVDCEYNRRGTGDHDIKVSPDPNHNWFAPDLIIHERGSDHKNFLLAEFKWWTNPKCYADRIKVQQIMGSKAYHYEYGIVVIIQQSWFGMEVYSKDKSSPDHEKIE